MKNKQVFMAIDPGRDKCGFAVMTEQKVLLAHCVCSTAQAATVACQLQDSHQAEFLVVGSGTNSKAVRQAIQAQLSLPIYVVNEYKTTELARQKYWQANPPSGLRRLVPRGMLIPPVPIDDFAAVAIGEKYLDEKATTNIK